MRHLLLCALLAIAAACSRGGAPSPEAEAERFHRLYSEGDYASLYPTVSEVQRSGMDAAMFADLMDFARDRFGPVRDATLSSMRRHDRDGVGYVLLRYDTRFERGSAHEVISYRIGPGEQLELEGYHITSPGWPGMLWGGAPDEVP